MTTITTRSGKGSPLTNDEVDANFTNLNTDKAELSGAAFTGAITTNSTFDGRDVATDGTKLDGIEASADVTDTANVTAAGALMDSELTSIASVKALNQGVATTDSPTFAGLTTTANMSFGDNDKALFGAGSDLSIYHDGARSYISDQGTGGVRILTNEFSIKSPDESESLFLSVQDGSTYLYNDNTIRLTTTSTGIQVTGNISNASGDLTLDVAGSIVLDADSSNIYLADGGTDIGLLSTNNQDLNIRNLISNKDIYFQGNDGGSTITALTLDMSASGAATFNSTVTVGSNMGNFIPVTSGTTGASLNANGNGLLQLQSGGVTKATINDSGVFTCDGGVVVDNITIDGNEIDLSSGDLTLDVAGLIVLDADNVGAVQLKDGGTLYGTFSRSTNDLNIASNISDADITFSGSDGGSTITALTLDMSAAGAATFNSNVILPDNSYFLFGDTTSGIQGNSSSDFIKFYTANTSRFQIASDGSLFTPTAGTSNVRFGANAGNSIVSGGNYNVVVGDEAGTAITTGDENTGTGYNSLSAITTGSYNTAFGKGSLASDTLGSQSVAVGANALQSQNFTSATSTYNTAVGYYAGQSVTTGVQNTLIGGLAGDALTSSSDNTAVGYQALGSATTGNENTAVGHSALFTNILSDRNVALGLDALRNHNQASSIDSYNTAVGYNTGAAVTTGIQNTLIGGLAGDALTDADNNVALGYSAMTTNVLGSESVAIGTFALNSQNPASATNMYNVAVGHNSGAAVTTGIRNTFVGSLAGDGTDDGAENVAVGESALSANCGNGNTALGREALKVATGTYNTSVGYQTGDNITDGSYNILVGAGCVPSGASAEVQIVMGANATGVANGNFTIGNGSTDSNLVLGATTWTAPSDSRMKEDVATSTAGISFVNDLRPVTYKWKKEKDLPDSMDAYVEGSEKRVINDKTNHGFIAQEVKSAIDAHPEIKDGFDMWMEKDSDGQQRVAPSALIPILTKAIQEQQALIEALTARIETLEG